MLRKSLLLVWASFAAMFPALTAALEIRFEPITPGVYAYIGDIEGRTYENEGLNANLGLVVTSSGAVLIDSGATYKSAQKIHAAVKKVTSEPIRWVINTGGQDHRWLGNGYFKSVGVEILAHEKVLPDMKARASQHLQGLSVLKEKLEGTIPTPPTRLIAEPDHNEVLGGVPFEFKYRGGGHTPGDWLVWLPQSGVLFAGDIVYVDRVLGLHEVSNTKQWLASFAALEELKPRMIVPGHGKVTDLRTAQLHTRDLLVALRTHALKAVDDGVDISAAVKTFNPKSFSHLQHAEIWIPQLVNRTYLEVERE
jgi:glyoxylase-like metal-dependent hydrolase (beta-lactamase superfamily II)